MRYCTKQYWAEEAINSFFHLNHVPIEYRIADKGHLIAAGRQFNIFRIITDAAIGEWKELWQFSNQRLATL